MAKVKSIRIDDELWKEFGEVAQSKCIDKVEWLEHKIKEFIELNKGK